MMSQPRPKKFIVLVHEHLYGGGSRQSFYILKRLIEDGHEAVLVSNAKEGWLGRALAEANLPVKTYYTNLIQRPLNPCVETALFFYLWWVFVKEGADVILSAGVKLIGLSAVVGWLARVPSRIAIIRGQGAVPGSKQMTLVYAMQRFMALLGSRFVAVSEYNRQEFLTESICPKEQVVTVHNGTDVAQYTDELLPEGQLRVQYDLPDNAFVIGMAGRLCAQKRYKMFVEFMARLCATYPHVHGFLVGEGEDREWLEPMVADTGYQDRIHLTGFVQNMRGVYRDLDLSVLFTNYEGCPNVLVESTAAGVPMIADRVCGNPEVVRHQENGFVVESGDLDSAVGYAEQLIEDAELRKTFSDNARRIARESFDRRQLLGQLIQTALAPLN